jgi:hypothetical protein
LVEHDQRKLSMTNGNQGTYPQSCTHPGPAPTRFLVGSDLHVPPPEFSSGTHASTAQASTPAPRPPPAAASSSFGRQRIGPPPPRSPRATTGLALRHHRLLLCHRPDCLGHSLLDAPVAAQLCAVVGSSSPDRAHPSVSSTSVASPAPPRRQ